MKRRTFCTDLQSFPLCDSKGLSLCLLGRGQCAFVRMEEPDFHLPLSNAGCRFVYVPTCHFLAAMVLGAIQEDLMMQHKHKCLEKP